MTPEYAFEDDVTSAEEFRAVLGQLLDAAETNDVDARGSWVFRDGKLRSHLEVMVLELESD